MSARYAIGIGASSNACADDVVTLVVSALSTLDAARAAVVCLASLDRRSALARDVAAALGVPAVTYDAATLGTVPGALVASARALASVGCASVAEAAALAALGEGGRLVVARTTGIYCTCAIAEVG